MIRTSRAVVIALLLTIATVGGALAQTAPPAPNPPAVPSAPPQRLLTMDHAVAIALEAQPELRARLFDYAAARWAVLSAFAPLLPQLTGTVGANRTHTTTLLTSAASGNTAAIPIDRFFKDTFSAQASLSQLIFDFGQTRAATDTVT